MAITTLQEKMLHELADIYDAEHQFLEAQQQMITHANADTVKQMLQTHIQQTEQQIKNLEQVFQALGQQLKREKCAAAAGLVTEGNKLLKEVSGNPALVDLAIAGSQTKVEHYEVASYRGLVMSAQVMGKHEILPLLQANLQQEEQTAQLVEQSTPQLIQQAMSAMQRGA